MPSIHPNAKDNLRAEKMGTTLLAPRFMAERIRAQGQGQTTWCETSSAVFLLCESGQLNLFQLQFSHLFKSGDNTITYV